MQTDINDSRYPGMWLTVGDGITLYAQFHLMKENFDAIRGTTEHEYTKLIVKNNRDGKWWDFDTGKFGFAKKSLDLPVNGLAQWIRFFTDYKLKGQKR